VVPYSRFGVLAASLNAVWTRAAEGGNIVNGELGVWKSEVPSFTGLCRCGAGPFFFFFRLIWSWSMSGCIGVCSLSWGLTL